MLTVLIELNYKCWTHFYYNTWTLFSIEWTNSDGFCLQMHAVIYFYLFMLKLFYVKGPKSLWNPQKLIVVDWLKILIFIIIVLRPFSFQLSCFEIYKPYSLGMNKQNYFWLKMTLCNTKNQTSNVLEMQLYTKYEANKYHVFHTYFPSACNFSLLVW